MLGLVARGGWCTVNARVTHNHVRYWRTGPGYHTVFMTLSVWLCLRYLSCVVMKRLLEASET
jgi:hypothetical protein